MCSPVAGESTWPPFLLQALWQSGTLMRRSCKARTLELGRGSDDGISFVRSGTACGSSDRAPFETKPMTDKDTLQALLSFLDAATSGMIDPSQEFHECAEGAFL